MRHGVPALLALLMLATALVGQAKPGHVYGVGYYQAFPGKEAAYNRAYADVVIPVFNELVKRNVVVSYLQLTQVAGAGEYTHILIVEYANWATFDGFVAKRNEAAQAVFHKSYSEVFAGFPELRRQVRGETYVAAGQQP
jgi:hypothetical protein